MIARYCENYTISTFMTLPAMPVFVLVVLFTSEYNKRSCSVCATISLYNGDSDGGENIHDLIDSIAV